MESTKNAQMQDPNGYYAGAWATGTAAALVVVGTALAAYVTMLCVVANKSLPCNIPRADRAKLLEPVFGAETRRILKIVSISLISGGPAIGVGLGLGAAGLCYRGTVVAKLPVPSRPPVINSTKPHSDPL